MDSLITRRSRPFSRVVVKVQQILKDDVFLFLARSLIMLNRFGPFVFIDESSFCGMMDGFAKLFQNAIVCNEVFYSVSVRLSDWGIIISLLSFELMAMVSWWFWQRKFWVFVARCILTYFIYIDLLLKFDLLKLNVALFQISYVHKIFRKTKHSAFIVMESRRLFQ